MLKREGIQFQVCRNPDVKSVVIERAHRTIRDRMYKYFTYKNTYRYIVDPKFFRAYNETVHSATGMAPSRYGREWWLGDILYASRRPSFACGNTCASGKR